MLIIKGAQLLFETACARGDINGIFNVQQVGKQKRHGQKDGQHTFNQHMNGVVTVDNLETHAMLCRITEGDKSFQGCE